jgi:RNA polymerase sigma-70 factor, ECF subfamily
MSGKDYRRSCIAQWDDDRTRPNSSSRSSTEAGIEAALGAKQTRVLACGGVLGSDSDGDLVCRISAHPAGDREAETELCRRFGPRIRLYGLRHLRSSDRASDLVQAVLLAVLTAARAGRVTNPEHFHRFVLGTCRHIARRLHQGESRLVPVGDELPEVPVMPDLDRVDVGALFRCLSRLETRARMVVLLSFQDERSPREIAQALETSLGNVRVMRHRAIIDLRKCMEGEP